MVALVINQSWQNQKHSVQRDASFLKTASTRILAGFVLTLAVLCPHERAGAAVVTVDLGSASSFAVLADTGITNTGATTITGDVGSFPTTSITGFESVTLNGTNHGGDTVTQVAKIDLAAAYEDAEGRTPTETYDPIYDLGGLVLGSGVYNDPSSFGITGTLTLDGQGDANAVWIFQAGSTLTTASNSNVVLIGGAQASNVFWQIGSSATLGTNSVFVGSLLAWTSVTLNTGAVIEGRALALNGEVTLDTNTINSVPEPSGMLLTVFGLTVFLIFRCSLSRMHPGRQGR